MGSTLDATRFRKTYSSYRQQPQLQPSNTNGANDVNLEENGVPLVGNPYKTINVVGSGGSIVDAGGGTATLTLSGSGGSSPFQQPGGVGTAIQPFDTTSSTQLDTSTATGTNSFAAVGGNASSLNSVALLGGSATTESSMAIGAGAQTAEGEVTNTNMVAIGTNAVAFNATDGVAIGHNSNAGANSSTAIGFYASTVSFGSVAIGSGSITNAFGQGGDIAIGGGQTNGSNSIAIGPCTTNEDASYVFGNDGTVSGSISCVSFNADGNNTAKISSLSGSISLTGPLIDIEGVSTATGGSPPPLNVTKYLTLLVNGVSYSIPMY